MIPLQNRFKNFMQSIPPVVLAMMFMVIASLLFSAMHAIIRIVSAELHPFEIAFFRNVFGFCALAPMFLKYGFSPMKTDKLHLHGLRALLQTCAMLLFFYGVTITQLAKVSALGFSAPLFATIGAVIIFREKMNRHRLIALAAGFIGAVIILQPGSGLIEPGAIMVLTSSVFWAMAMLVIKVLSRTESGLTVTLFMGAFMTLTTLVPALFVWQWPSWGTLVLMVFMGAAGSFAHVLLTEAFKRADTAVVVPFDFARLLFASFLGYVIFSEVPALWTWVGGGVIFAAATFLAVNESRRALKKSPAQK